MNGEAAANGRRGRFESLSIEHYRLRPRFPAVGLDSDILPPRGVTSLLRRCADLKAVRRDLAGEFDAQVGATLVIEGPPVILINAAAAIVACVDLQSKWPLRCLIRALDERFNRDYGAAVSKNGQLIQLRLHAEGQRSLVGRRRSRVRWCRNLGAGQ